jgi:fatty-acyl-CoA synthase
MSEQRVTVFTSPNFGYDHLCSAATPDLLSELDLSAWRLAFNGAEPVRAESVKTFTATFAPAGLSPTAMYPVYGMAEATLAICFPPPGALPRVEWVDRAELGRSGRAVPAPPESPEAKGLVSVGKPVHGIELRIVGEDGAVLGEAELGEIQISGPPVSRGYYRNAAATNESRDGDWFRTGDLGLLLDGDLFITGRRKDMIVVRGQNYFAEDVEQIAREVDGVYKRNCVAFADTQEEGSERLTVVVEVSTKVDARLVAEQVQDMVRTGLDVNAVRVHAVPPRWIPKTTSGKWKRATAREQIVSGTHDVLATSQASGR